MNRKLLLGSLLVLTLLLLMPSIPAIQQNIVKGDIKDKILSELSEDLDFKDIKELVDSGKLDDIKHPLLYRFVILRLKILYPRAAFWFILILVLCCEPAGYGVEIVRPKLAAVLGCRMAIIYSRITYWTLFWIDISNRFGWNWDLHL